VSRAEDVSSAKVKSQAFPLEQMLTIFQLSGVEGGRSVDLETQVLSSSSSGVDANKIPCKRCREQKTCGVAEAKSPVLPSLEQMLTRLQEYGGEYANDKSQALYRC
jgi:hypothetical protein